MKKPHDITSRELRTSPEAGSAANDRLQCVEASDSSNRDLLALNERLTAENALLRRKLEEYYRADHDMENMLQSAGAASLLPDRRSTIKKFIESEQRLRLFIEHAPAALAMFDTEMRYLCMSRRWLRDYRLGERDLVGESHYDVFPEVSTEWREAHRRGLAGEVLRAEGDRFERADGSVQWVRWEIRPWHDAGGEIGGIVIFAEDITHLKAAEEVLSSFQLLAAHSRDIFLIIRRGDGRILEANSAAVTSYGFHRDELLGLTIFDLRPAETVESTFAQMAEADVDGIIFETVHRRRDGSTFPVEVSSQGAFIGSTRTLISVVRDITDRKRVDDALRASREKFSTMFQTLPIAIALAAMPGGELYDVNPAWLELAGFARKEEVIGKTSLELGLIADAVQRETILKEFRRHGSVRNSEQSIVSRGGAPRILLVNLDSVEIGGQKYILSAMADITERKRAEESLRKSEERYRSLVETARFAIFINRDNRIEYANPAALKLFGAENIHDLIGRSPYDFVHPDFHAAMSERIKIVADGGSVPLNETRILRENGDERCVEVTAVVFTDHRGPAVQVMMHDVTERKRVAKALQESEEQFRTLADAIPQLCWMAHPDGWIFWYNQRWYQYTGTTAKQMVGWGWQSVHDPAVLPMVLEKWQDSIATGKPFDMAFPLRGADGAFRPFLTRVLPLKDSTGQVLRWFGTSTDISDLKQAEDALRESESRYSALFANKINGIAHCRVITDERGLPVDYRILQINEAYERIIGIRKTDIEGRTVREVFPDIENYAFDYIGVYGKIALEGGEIKFEEFFEATGQHLAIYAYSAMQGEFTAIFTDVTERKHAEEELLQKNLALESMAIELSLAEERERDRIAGELHDQVGQRLILGKMKLDALACQLQNDGSLHEVEALGRIVELSIQDIRSLTFQLRPPLLASAGLEAALRWLGEEFQDTYGLTLIFSDDGQLKPMMYEVRSTVFQAAREMLLNIVKHAGATHFGITVSRQGCVLQLCLSDNGCGFDLAAVRMKKSKSGGFGLVNAQRRIDHLGGSLLIDSRPGDGTRITITTPLDLSHPNARGYL